MALNPLPALLATLLVEQGDCLPEQISIHPTTGQGRPALREVLEVKKDKKTQHIRLMVRSKSPELLELEQKMSANHAFMELKPLFEQETTLFQMKRCARARRHLLGQSGLQPAFLHETWEWEDKYKKILAFFLPYRSQIRGDMVLTEKCLGAALDQTVTVTYSNPLTSIISGAPVGKILMNSSAKIGGGLSSANPCVRIAIGPVDVRYVAQFAPGSPQMIFLEKALLPIFLPETMDWKIRIETAPDLEECCVATQHKPLIVNINSTIKT